MIKVFTLNKNGKIELTKKELEQLLNESYYEGYWKGYGNKGCCWTYTSPSITPYFTTNASTITSDTKNPYTIDGSNINAGSITLKTVSDIAETIK